MIVLEHPLLTVRYQYHVTLELSWPLVCQLFPSLSCLRSLNGDSIGYMLEFIHVLQLSSLKVGVKLFLLVSAHVTFSQVWEHTYTLCCCSSLSEMVYLASVAS